MKRLLIDGINTLNDINALPDGWNNEREDKAKPEEERFEVKGDRLMRPLLSQILLNAGMIKVAQMNVGRLSRLPRHDIGPSIRCVVPDDGKRCEYIVLPGNGCRGGYSHTNTNIHANTNTYANTDTNSNTNATNSLSSFFSTLSDSKDTVSTNGSKDTVSTNTSSASSSIPPPQPEPLNHNDSVSDDDFIVLGVDFPVDFLKAKLGADSDGFTFYETSDGGFNVKIANSNEDGASDNKLFELSKVKSEHIPEFDQLENSSYEYLDQHVLADDVLGRMLNQLKSPHFSNNTILKQPCQILGVSKRVFVHLLEAWKTSSQMKNSYQSRYSTVIGCINGLGEIMNNNSIIEAVGHAVFKYEDDESDPGRIAFTFLARNDRASGEAFNWLWLCLATFIITLACKGF